MTFLRAKFCLSTLAQDLQKVIRCNFHPHVTYKSTFFLTGTGLHRYVFLVYKQNGKINPDEKRLTNRSGEGRANVSFVYKKPHTF